MGKVELLTMRHSLRPELFSGGTRVNHSGKLPMKDEKHRANCIFLLTLQIERQLCKPVRSLQLDPVPPSSWPYAISDRYGAPLTYQREYPRKIMVDPSYMG